MASDTEYRVMRFREDEPRESEPMGTKKKYWIRRNGIRWLFKRGRRNTGEDWAEKVACELAEVLGVEAARVQLAELKDGPLWLRGTASRNFVADDEELVHGNELLAKHLDYYEKDKRFDQYDHRVDAVVEILETELDRGCVEQFIGYLVLDAWIANVDRHHENWGVLRSSENDRIAPTFDHASSLGRLLDDEKRTRVLEGRGRLTVEKYLTRSDSGGAVYPRSGAEQVPPYQLLPELCELGCAEEVEGWVERLVEVDDTDVEEVFSLFPDGWTSEPAIRFALAILETTERLIRDAVEASSCR